MGLLGSAPDAVDTEEHERTEYLWPECVSAWACWVGVQTQWRVGMGGATGLDYAGVRAHLEELRDAGDLPAEDRADVWRCIQAAERATLEVWSDRRKSDEARRPAPAAPAVPGF